MPGTRPGGGSQGWDPPDQGWARIGGSFKPGSALSVTSWGGNVLDVFGIGADGQVWHKAWRWRRPTGTRRGQIGRLSEAISRERRYSSHLLGAGPHRPVRHRWRQQCLAQGLAGEPGWDPPDQGWARIGGNFALTQVPSLLRVNSQADFVPIVGWWGCWGDIRSVPDRSVGRQAEQIDAVCAPRGSRQARP